MASIDTDSNWGKKHVHKQRLRDSWNHMTPLQKLDYLKHPHNVKVVINAFITRGPSEESASGLFRTLNYIGAIDPTHCDNKPRKFCFQNPSWFEAKVSTLLNAPEILALDPNPEEVVFRCVDDIVKVAEQDMLDQGWCYDFSEKYAYRVKVPSLDIPPTLGLYYA